MSEEEEGAASPFTRPGFIASALVVALVVILGIVVVVTHKGGGRTPATSATASSGGSDAASADSSGSAPPQEAESDSVCGLTGVVMNGTVSQAPQAQWDYIGVFPYPTSDQYGPAATADEGYRYCFQHSPQGAVFAAATAAAQANNPVSIKEWFAYVTADGTYHDQILEENTDADTTTGARVNSIGFKVLSYSGDSATIDIGFSGLINWNPYVASAVEYLVWQNGDWKLSSETQSPLNLAMIPTLDNYIVWRS